jgi:uncharacterized protein (DUF302 family)
MMGPEVGGMISIPCKRSVDETVERLKQILQTNGITLFLLMDHSGEAQKLGISMAPTKLLIFGSPRAGTPLMLAAPSIAIDLPLKILVWEDAEGLVWLAYNSPSYLQRRHSLPMDLMRAVEVVEGLAQTATQSE